ncbi:hypothetical protein IFM89_002524 [Coptis chinensis]|uniref:Uncharacterized protein n=1 Tax=Coptis chinensis TaxID=261450 RepID=A0A835HJC0_9MAGN|nr:hypothetical protein IFM89_002524 [Coptis chinensis]
MLTVHGMILASNTWISPSLGSEGPDAREGHSAALIGKDLFIFGGCRKSPDNSNEVYYNDLYILDTVNMVESPDACQQYRRILEGYRQPKVQSFFTVLKALSHKEVHYRFYATSDQIRSYCDGVVEEWVYEDITGIFRKQKVDMAIDEAISWVLSMVESPDTCQQYRHIIEGYHQAKKKRKDAKEEEDEGELENDDLSTSKIPRVVWSVELHQQFVTAVNQLRIDKKDSDEIQVEIQISPKKTKPNNMEETSGDIVPSQKSMA